MTENKEAERGFSKSQFVKNRPLVSAQSHYRKEADYQKGRQSAPVLEEVRSCVQHWRSDRFDRHGAEIKKGSRYHISFKD